MFHVAPYLSSEQHRRLVGNDICVLIYFDEPNAALTLSPLAFDGLGTVPQVFAVVQPQEQDTYRLGFFRRSNLKSYGPECPPSAYTFNVADVKDYLFTKLHNGFAMAMVCPPMNRLFITPRAATIKALGEKYAKEDKKKMRKERERAEREKVRTGRREGGQNVVVTVVSGRNLVSRDDNGLSDPFIVVHFVDQREKSAVIRKTLNPEWNAQFTFSCAGVSDQTQMQFTVMDWDRFSADDYMGEVSVPYVDITAMAANPTKATWFTLISTTGEVVSGDVCLKFSLA